MTEASNPVIRKPNITDMAVRPNLDYETLRSDFNWADVHDELD